MASLSAALCHRYALEASIEDCTRCSNAHRRPESGNHGLQVCLRTSTSLGTTFRPDFRLGHGQDNVQDELMFGRGWRDKMVLSVSGRHGLQWGGQGGSTASSSTPAILPKDTLTSVSDLGSEDYLQNLESDSLAVDLDKPSVSGSGELSEAQRAVDVALRRKLEMGRVDTNLLSTGVHRAWVAAGCLAVTGVFLKAGLAVGSWESLVGAIVSAVSAYVLADLGTGIYHWGVDNYGDANTPVFGAQIDAFQGHHQRPWTITKRQFANNLHALARPACFVLLPFLLAPCNAYLDAFVGTFMTCVVLSQQFHAWSHTPKPLLPPLVVTLQDAGIVVGRRMHGAHHKPPYNVNYCIVSGICNSYLDRSRLLPWMEAQILETWGVAPRSWGETAPEWLEISYYEDGAAADESRL